MKDNDGNSGKRALIGPEEAFTRKANRGEYSISSDKTDFLLDLYAASMGYYTHDLLEEAGKTDADG